MRGKDVINDATSDNEDSENKFYTVNWDRGWVSASPTIIPHKRARGANIFNKKVGLNGKVQNEIEPFKLFFPRNMQLKIMKCRKDYWKIKKKYKSKDLDQT